MYIENFCCIFIFIVTYKFNFHLYYKSLTKKNDGTAPFKNPNPSGNKKLKCQNKELQFHRINSIDSSANASQNMLNRYYEWNEVKPVSIEMTFYIYIYKNFIFISSVSRSGQLTLFLKYVTELL